MPYVTRGRNHIVNAFKVNQSRKGALSCSLTSHRYDMSVTLIISTFNFQLSQISFTNQTLHLHILPQGFYTRTFRQ